jgi:hypothetical protein
MTMPTRVVLAIIVSVAVATLTTFLMRPACKPVEHEHWHYANCNRIAQYCAIG